MSLVPVAALLAPLATPGAAAESTAGEKLDPERQICKSKAAVGSRLKRIRECATAQQWEEMALAERLGLMRKQYNGDPGCNGGGHCGVKNGGRDTPW